MKDNVCDNALDLTNGYLNVDDNWPYGTNCQWLILAQDNNSYVMLEFENFNVRKKYCIERMIWLCRYLSIKNLLDWELEK